MALVWSKNQHREGWLHVIKEIHSDFWHDSDMIEVRAWLANDEAYQSVQPLFKKRSDRIIGRDDAQALSAEEYKATIDKLDKFLHLMLRVIEVNPHMSKQEKVLHELFAYWINRVNSQERKEIRIYTQHYFPMLVEYEWKYTNSSRLMSRENQQRLQH